MGNPDVTPTRDDLLAELLAIIEPPKLGEEWFTAKDVMAQRGLKYDTANDWLRKAIDAGKIERQKINGRWHFRVKK